MQAVTFLAVERLQMCSLIVCLRYTIYRLLPSWGSCRKNYCPPGIADYMCYRDGVYKGKGKKVNLSLDFN
jgi:hypothetical protein